MKLRLLYILLAIGVFISCEEEPAAPQQVEFTTLSAEDVSFSNAVLNGLLIVGKQGIKDCGFVWSINPNPVMGTVQEVHLGPQDTNQSLSHELTGLDPNTTYYFRTFLVKGTKTMYGSELSFTTLQHSTFLTKSSESIAFTEATIVGELSIKDEEIFDCGFVWSTSTNPTTATSNKKYFGPQTVDRNLSYNLVGLNVNTTYYFRAFIISEGGISYGDELSFTTLPEITWEVPGGFPGDARMGGVSFVIGSNAYFGLGHGHDEEAHTKWMSDFWKFDMIANTWTQVESYPGGARSGAVAFAINDKGYVGTGGSPTGGTKDFWEYNPATDEWTKKADYLGGNVGWASAFSLGGKGYIGTGVENGNGPFLKTFYEYNPVSNEWTKKADFPGLAIDQAIGFSIGEYGYIGMGLRMESWLGNPKELWAYLPASDIWEKKQDCPTETSLYGSIAFVLNNKAYVGLGWGAGTTIWAYDPDTNQWSEDGAVGIGRIGAVAFPAGTKAVIGTGSTPSGFYKDFVEYNPK